MNSRNKRRIEPVDLFDGHHAALQQDGEAARQKMPVDDVANLIDGVALPGRQVEVPAGQFLPVETDVGDVTQPAKHIRPGLPLKTEATQHAVPVGTNEKFRGIGRRLGLVGAPDCLWHLGFFFSLALFLAFVFLFPVGFGLLGGLFLNSGIRRCCLWIRRASERLDMHPHWAVAWNNLQRSEFACAVFRDDDCILSPTCGRVRNAENSRQQHHGHRSAPQHGVDPFHDCPIRTQQSTRYYSGRRESLCAASGTRRNRMLPLPARINDPA